MKLRAEKNVNSRVSLENSNKKIPMQCVQQKAPGSFIWRGTWDSNPEPTDSKSGTLSVELVPHMSTQIIIMCIPG